MYLQSLNNWSDHPNKRIMLFGMSGLGKTHIADLLRKRGHWYHYSVDYRIGTRYMGEHITDNFKAEAMRNPFLAGLLRSDAIYIASNITFNNLSPLASYLGKPGNTAKGGIPFDEYIKRQRQHRAGEIAAMRDTVAFITRAKNLYDYDHFVCDTSGSVIEVIDPNDPNDLIMSELSQYMLPVWIKGDSTHLATLIERFARAPKPMYYPEAFLKQCWADYCAEKSLSPDQVDPDDFIIWGYEKLLQDRLPRYEKLAQRWGITIAASDLQDLRDPVEFDALIAQAIGDKHAH